MLEAILVDDEPIAIRRLQILLEEIPGVRVAGACADGPAALALIRSASPDVVFLDIGLPGMSGMQLAALMRHMHRPPLVIFVTAFGNHGPGAFDLGAVHYLLKPVDRERLRDSVDRVRSLKARRAGAGLEDGDDRVWLSTGRGRVLVSLGELSWIGAERDYVRFHQPNQSWLVRGRINRVEACLRDRGFLRVHRSAVVREKAVMHIEPHGDRTWELVLGDGARLVTGRAYRANVSRLLAARPLGVG